MTGSGPGDQCTTRRGFCQGLFRPALRHSLQSTRVKGGPEGAVHLPLTRVLQWECAGRQGGTQNRLPAPGSRAAKRRGAAAPIGPGAFLSPGGEKTGKERGEAADLQSARKRRKILRAFFKAPGWRLKKAASEAPKGPLTALLRPGAGGGRGCERAPDFHAEAQTTSGEALLTGELREGALVGATITRGQGRPQRGRSLALDAA